MSKSKIVDVFIYCEDWKAGKNYDGFGDEWIIEMLHFINHPFTQTLAALAKCADFQAKGGSCVMVCPSISLENCDLYNQVLKHTTVRVDLPLFAFDGFKTPLMKHICLLYFLSPKFAN